MVFASVAEGKPTVSHPRLLVVAGESSQAQILERYVGRGVTFTNAVTEVWLGAGAVIDHYKVQEESADAFHIASMYLHGGRSGTSPRTRSRSAARSSATTSWRCSTAKASTAR